MDPEKAAQRIQQEVKAMSRLVRDLSLVSQVESKAVELHPKPLDPLGLLEQVTERFRPAFQAKGVALEVSANGPPRVWADEERALQVLSNLLSNALRHTPAGGRVTLGAEKVNQEVVFSVEDTGPGIPEEHLPHIFERFYRIDPSRSRQDGGTGVGLTIAKGLVEAMGGRIWAESRLGQGSVFRFTLPLYTGLTG